MNFHTENTRHGYRASRSQIERCRDTGLVWSGTESCILFVLGGWSGREAQCRRSNRGVRGSCWLMVLLVLRGEGLLRYLGLQLERELADHRHREVAGQKRSHLSLVEVVEGRSVQAWEAVLVSLGLHLEGSGSIQSKKRNRHMECRAGLLAPLT
jgi:hypothetical protein